MATLWLFFMQNQSSKFPQCRTNDMDDNFTFLTRNAIIPLRMHISHHNCLLLWVAVFNSSTSQVRILGVSLVKTGHRHGCNSQETEAMLVFRYKVTVSAARLCSWGRILCAKHLKFAPDKTATPTRVWWYMDVLILLDLYVVLGIIRVQNVCFGLRSGEAWRRSEWIECR